jgi:L-lactate dehydrogenase complex protein LldG
MSDARSAILDAIRRGRGNARSIPDYPLPLSNEDQAARFAEKAVQCAAEVKQIASIADAPEAIFALLSASGAPLRLHLSDVSPLNDLPWQRAPGLSISRQLPSGDDTAFSAANYGIAETGTLAFFSGPRSLSSWHYRPGREIVLLERHLILPRLEDLFLRIGAMPATLNLVTGPSRTADIEQTIELGAHGPRSLNILIAG